MKYSSEDLAQLERAFLNLSLASAAKYLTPSEPVPTINEFLIKLAGNYDLPRAKQAYIWQVYWIIHDHFSYRPPQQYNDSHIESAMKHLIKKFTAPTKLF